LRSRGHIPRLRMCSFTATISHTHVLSRAVCRETNTDHVNYGRQFRSKSNMRKPGLNCPSALTCTVCATRWSPYCIAKKGTSHEAAYLHLIPSKLLTASMEQSQVHWSVARNAQLFGGIGSRSNVLYTNTSVSEGFISCSEV
jgi:hypothetical protein